MEARQRAYLKRAYSDEKTRQASQREERLNLANGIRTLSEVMERVTPLPLEFPLFLLSLLAHHRLDLRAHNVLWGDVHACIVL